MVILSFQVLAVPTEITSALPIGKTALVAHRCSHPVGEIPQRQRSLAGPTLVARQYAQAFSTAPSEAELASVSASLTASCRDINRVVEVDKILED